MDLPLKYLEDVLCISRVQIDVLRMGFETIIKTIDKKFAQATPAQLIFGSLTVAYIAMMILTIMFNLYKSLTWKNVLVRLRSLPVVRVYVERKIEKLGLEIKAGLLKVYQDEPFISKLPDKQSKAESILNRVHHYNMFDMITWKNGRLSGGVYTQDIHAYSKLLSDVYLMHMWSNPLHSDVFACVRKMEGEIVRMTGAMFNGDPQRIRGSVTSGGTESIFMACKAYRDYAIKVRGVKGQPEIVAPVTAHAAFEKAASILGCKIIHIPVDKMTFKVDMAKMRASIGRNTCMLVGSAPQFPHGIVDPIEQIAILGHRNGLPVHVDACLGGFLIAFMKDAKVELDEKFDFSLAGVTSISADTHKYGYAPKGTSVILYKEKKYIHQQYCIQTDWPGGVYASPTLPGSRPGGLIATCWTAMMYHGKEGYVAATQKIIETTRRICEGLRKVEGIVLLGEPKISVLAFNSNVFDIYEMNDKLKALGWNLNVLQFPAAIHLCVTLMHCQANVADSFVKDVSSVAKLLRDRPAGQASQQGESAAIYGMASTVPDRSIVAMVCTEYLDASLGF